MDVGQDFGTVILLGYLFLLFLILSPLILSLIFLKKSISSLKYKKAGIGIPIASLITSLIHVFVFSYIFLKYQDGGSLASYLILVCLTATSWYVYGKRKLLNQIGRAIIILFAILCMILILTPFIMARDLQDEINERTAIKQQALAQMEIQFYWPQHSSKYLHAERYSQGPETYLEINTSEIVGDMYMFNEKFYPRTQPCEPFPGPYEHVPDDLMNKPCMHIADINGFSIDRLDYTDGHDIYRFAKRGATSLIFETDWQTSDSDIEAYVATLKPVSVEVMADKVNY